MSAKGAAMTVGDFDKDGYGDLALGRAIEMVERLVAHRDACTGPSRWADRRRTPFGTTASNRTWP
ncbi:FG-GAP repeat protein [Streptomyces sp. NPDC005931]|uniref:FG-GAP repeat protein n=1 Tax=Streptomyces sp. NPDC005931 TaxID=3364737 RepID=UPI0036D14256